METQADIPYLLMYIFNIIIGFTQLKEVQEIVRSRKKQYYDANTEEND